MFSFKSHYPVDHVDHIISNLTLEMLPVPLFSTISPSYFVLLYKLYHNREMNDVVTVIDLLPGINTRPWRRKENGHPVHTNGTLI